MDQSFLKRARREGGGGCWCNCEFVPVRRLAHFLSTTNTTPALYLSIYTCLHVYAQPVVLCSRSKEGGFFPAMMRTDYALLNDTCVQTCCRRAYPVATSFAQNTHRLHVYIQGPDLRALADGAARARLGAVRGGARPDGAVPSQHPRCGRAVAPGTVEGSDERLGC